MWRVCLGPYRAGSARGSHFMLGAYPPAPPAQIHSLPPATNLLPDLISHSLTALPSIQYQHSVIVSLTAHSPWPLFLWDDVLDTLCPLNLILPEFLNLSHPWELCHTPPRFWRLTDQYSLNRPVRELRKNSPLFFFAPRPACVCLLTLSKCPVALMRKPVSSCSDTPVLPFFFFAQLLFNIRCVYAWDTYLTRYL